MSERQRDAKGSLSHGVTRKATPMLINRPSSLGKKENNGAVSSMTGAFDIAGKARQQGRIDDVVTWRKRENINIAVRGKENIDYHREVRITV